VERVNGKCSHGVYWPASDEVNLGCQQCNPAGLPDGPTPVMPRTAADALMQKVVAVTNCSKCGNVRTYSTPNCRVCATPFPEIDLRGIEGPANKHQVGDCPDCGSSVHYEVKDKPGKWECVECGKVFRAPKTIEGDSE
jgi:DNA-directed RNA polymerase subunit M/transcription elongation factor TFIIS